VDLRAAAAAVADALVLPVADSGEPALRSASSATSKASPAAVPAQPAGLAPAGAVRGAVAAAAERRRPQWLGEPLPIAASGRDLLVAVDVSGSMDFPDMQWQDEDVSRLSLVSICSATSSKAAKATAWA
jgi:Ca-activated chloride channel family protein